MGFQGYSCSVQALPDYQACVCAVVAQSVSPVAGQLPWLELYTTLERTAVEANSHIIEESVDGMDLVTGVLFEELGDNSTEITLRVGYYLPGVC